MQLLCVGDIALADKSINGRIWNVPGSLVPSENEKVMFNWEFPIGDTINMKPRLSGMRFLAPPGSEAVVKNWSPGIATLATNHILDAAEEGLAQTINSLQQAGFATVGAGTTAEEAARPLLWETTEGKLTIINWVFAETNPDWMKLPGPNCWPGFHEARCIIHAAKDTSDWVVVVVHWSDELFPYPLPQDREIARELASMGADIVLGHHPHVVRGMEVFGSCPVFYSLGNFYFAEIKSKTGDWLSQEAPRNREGLGVSISFRRGKLPECQLLSFWNTGYDVLLDPKRRAEKRLKWTSIPLQKSQNASYAEWYKMARAHFDKWTSRWHFGVMRRGVMGTLQRIVEKLRKLALASE